MQANKNISYTLLTSPQKSNLYKTNIKKALFKSYISALEVSR